MMGKTYEWSFVRQVSIKVSAFGDREKSIHQHQRMASITIRSTNTACLRVSIRAMLEMVRQMVECFQGLQTKNPIVEDHLTMHVASLICPFGPACVARNG
jgi:hypothetical protein